ncbi:hypothetical protein RDI58_026166 [Solanum bulbocastanum]|uniref:Uncharacterized protein n=1 Tax=Solanum bulbocastanum TaxID=147425 RepID=A0AAN8Y0L8_SOLBU
MIFNTIVHEGETLPLQCDDSFCEDVSLNTKVPTAMLHDTKESNTEEEYNPRDNVALFDKCPKRDTSGFSGSFSGQARPGTYSLRDLPHSTPAVKSEEEDSGEAIGKKMIISLVRKLEYYDAAILKIPTFVYVTTTVRQ